VDTFGSRVITIFWITSDLRTLLSGIPIPTASESTRDTAPIPQIFLPAVSVLTLFAFVFFVSFFYSVTCFRKTSFVTLVWGAFLCRWTVTWFFAV
jgi:hypothetical protein